jgi:hypothetical protein
MQYMLVSAAALKLSKGPADLGIIDRSHCLDVRTSFRRHAERTRSKWMLLYYALETPCWAVYLLRCFNEDVAYQCGMRGYACFR